MHRGRHLSLAVLKLTRKRNKESAMTSQREPRELNEARAARAVKAFRTFQRDPETDDQNALRDLLCGLMHWCDRNGCSLDKAFWSARRRHHRQTLPEISVSVTVSVPDWKQQLKDFNGLDILPHVLADGDYYSPCQASKAEVWIVFPRNSTGHGRSCGRFVTKAEARAFCHRLIAMYPHLARGSDYRRDHI
jgi:hypothetical protein